MNHIVSKAVIGTRPDSGVASSGRLNDYLIVLVMMVYSVLAFGGLAGEDQLATVVAISIVTYFLTFAVFYGVTQLAYRRHTFLLWGAVVAAITVAYFISGLSGIWTMLTGWSMFLFAGAIAGRLSLAEKSPLKIYMLSGACVVLFVIAQQVAIWPVAMEGGAAVVGKWLDDLEKTLVASGQDVVAVRENIDYTRKLMAAFTRLLPSMSIMGSLMQFTVAYLFFLSRIDGKLKIAPFSSWKIPFGFMPAVIVAIALRYLGNDTTALIADNVLAVLAVYYCIAGLALMEFFLKRAKVSRLAKGLFYLMLFFTQLIGLFVTALLGFVDSFTDWRKTYLERTN